MKRLILGIVFSIVILSLIGFVSAAYPSGVIAHWDFEGDLADNSGNGNDAVIVNDVTFVPGVMGQAGSFVALNSPNDHGQLDDVSDFTNLRTTGFTVGAWVKFDADSSPDPNGDAIVHLGTTDAEDGGVGNYRNFFDLERSSGNIVSFANSHPGGETNLVSTSSVANNQWKYIVASWNPSTQTKKIYLDCLPNAVAGGANFASQVEGPLLIGADRDAASPTINDHMDGDIDELVIFNRALSDSEVSQLCNIPPGPVTVDDQCIDSQTILRLSAADNAHGEIYNGTGNYPIEICYDEIFGVAYTGVNPHTCVAGNTVLKLAGTTNSHAEGPTGTNYNTNVCYGNLICRNTTGACDSANGERFVVSLSNGGNAHLASDTSYSNRICCISPSTTAISSQSCDLTSATWTPSGSVSNNTLVTLSVNGNNCNGQQIKFDIHEDDPLTDDLVLTKNDVYPSTTWTAIWTYIGDDDFGNDPRDYYFNASLVSNASESVKSGNLAVSKQGGTVIPGVQIVIPEHRQIYFTGVLVEFRANLTVGTVSSYLWTVEDEDGNVEFTRTEATFNHTFSSGGQRTITLRVTNSAGSDEDQVAILVTASPGILAFINAPMHKQFVVNNLWQVSASATDSYVINRINGVGGCVIAIECLAGNCPDETKSPPTGCSANIQLIGELNKGYGNLHFDWLFDDGDSTANLNIPNVIKQYAIPSGVNNDKLIKLNVSFDNETNNIHLTQPTKRIFTLVGEDKCVSGNGNAKLVYVDPNGNFEKEENVLTVNGACRGFDGTIGTGDDCCPVVSGQQQVCRDTGSSTTDGLEVRCVFPTVNEVIDACGDYNAQTTCEVDEFKVGKEGTTGTKDPAWKVGDDCDQANIVCNCAWKTGTTNECILNKVKLNTTITPNNPSNPGGGICVEASCGVKTISSTECDAEGYKTFTVRAETSNILPAGRSWCPGAGASACSCDNSGNAECIIEQRCGRSTIELPFFGVVQFVLGLVAIFLLYVIMFRRDLLKKLKI